MATNVELQTFDQQEMVGICGRNDEFLRIVRSAFDCTLVARGNSITVSGPEEQCQQLQLLLQELLFLYRQGLPLTTHDVRYSIFMVKEGKLDSLHRMYADTIIVNNRGRQVKAKTLGQWQYVETIRKNFITLGIGPAGTGKTYLAVALAVLATRLRMSFPASYCMMARALFPWLMQVLILVAANFSSLCVSAAGSMASMLCLAG